MENRKIDKKWGRKLLTAGLAVLIGTSMLPQNEVFSATVPTADLPTLSVKSTSPHVELNLSPGDRVGAVKGVKVGTMTAPVRINTNASGGANNGEVNIGAGELISPTGAIIPLSGGAGEAEISTHWETNTNVYGDEHFIMYVGSNMSRFSLEAYDNKKLVVARYWSGYWYYDTNNYMVRFTPNSNDFIVGFIKRNGTTSAGIDSYTDLSLNSHEVQRGTTRIYRGVGPVVEDTYATDKSAPGTPGGVTATHEASGIRFSYGASSDSGSSYTYRGTTNYLADVYATNDMTQVKGFPVSAGASNLRLYKNEAYDGALNGGVRVATASGTNATIKNSTGSVTYSYQPTGTWYNDEFTTNMHGDNRPNACFIMFAPDGDLQTRAKMIDDHNVNRNFRVVCYTSSGWRYDDNSGTYKAFTRKSNDVLIAYIFRDRVTSAGIDYIGFITSSTENTGYTPTSVGTDPRSWTANLTANVPSSGISGYSTAISTSSSPTPNTTTNTSSTNWLATYSSIGGLKPVQYFTVKSKDGAGNWSGERTFTLEAPYLTASASTSTWTNGNVGVTVGASSGTYIVNSITRNGSALWTSPGTRTDTVTANGTYTYVATDTNGFSWSDSVTIDNIDKTAPTGNLAASTTAWTNGNVTLNLTGVADSGGSGVRNIELPNGAFVTGTSASYAVSANGTYSFEIHDNAGNVTTRSITVSNIEKTAPTGTLTQTPTGWTNGNVTLNLTSIADTGGSGYYRTELPNGTFVTTTTASQVVTANGTYTFTIYDNAGNSATRSITVTNMDKSAPTGNLTSSVSNGEVTLSLTSIADTGGSGYYRTRLPDGTYVTTTSATYQVAVNGTYSFIIYDNAGNSTTKSLNVTNADTTPPTGNLAQTPTTATNGNVTLNLTSVADAGTGVKSITLPNGTVLTTGTSASQVVTANGTYTFTLEDNAGNQAEKTITVSNIDKTAPIGTLAANTTAWTDGDVTLNLTSVSDAGGSGLKNIKLPNGTFVTGTSASQVVTSNGTYSFVIYDNAGNSTTRSITVSNIDTTAPVGTLTANTTAWTDGDVTLNLTSVSDAGGSGLKNIKLPNGTFVTGTSASQVVTADGTYSFVIYDNAGNSTTRTITVSNIDKTAPTGNLAASTTAWTNGNVTLNLTSVADTGGSGLRNIELPNGTFVTGTSASYAVSANGTYTFKIHDNAGNATTRSINVPNIEKTAPTGTLTQTPTGWTNGNVTLNLASIADTGGSGYYRTKLPNGTFVTTTTASQVVTANGTYSFVIYDNAGNSTTKSLSVTNMDKIVPTGNLASTVVNGQVVLNLTGIADTGGSGYYRTRLPNGTYVTTTSATYQVTANGTYSFIIYDNAGNSTTESIDVTNVDTTPPTGNLAQTPTAWTNGNVTLNLTGVADIGMGVKSITLPNGVVVTTGTSASYVVSANGSYSFSIEDIAGNETVKSISVENIDKVKPTLTVTASTTAPTNDNVTVTATSDDSLSGIKSVTSSNGVIVNGKVALQSISANGTYTFTATDNAGNTISESITISNIDKTVPVGTLSANTTAWTKGDVTLNLTGISDAGGSGYYRTKLPNGTFVTSTSTAQVVTVNGTYSFVIYDNAGNSTTKTIVVSNIDKSVPGGTVVSNNTNPTNQPVTVTATGTDTGSGLEKIELMNGNYLGRNLLVNSNREVTGTNEFVQFADISPIIDQYGLVPITISFDIKTPVPGSVRVYTQNGSTAKYSIGGTNVNATTEYVRHSVTVTPTLQNGTVSPSMLAFYGTYSTGRIVSVRDVKVELGSVESEYTKAPEDGDLVGGKKDFEFSSNGTYQFLFEDKAGNQTTKSLTVSNIDTNAPTANIGASTTDWTNQNVTLTLSAIADTGTSGLKSVKLPNGNVITPVSATSYTHVVSANGTYNFEIEDHAGNSTTKSIVVSNIDKSAPNGNVSASTTAFTNQNVTLTFNGMTETGGAGLKQVTLPNGNVIAPVSASSYTHEVSANGSYTFKIEDHAGNVTNKTITVSNIDKSAPTGTLSASTTAWTKENVTLNLTGIADVGVSGIRNIQLPNGTLVTGTSASYVATSNGTYSFVIYDNAGNSTTRSITVSNIDKTLPVLNLSYNASTNVISASVSDAGGSLLKEITRPDGTKVTGTSTTFTPSTFGDYSFSVSDNAGNVTTKSIFADRIISIPDDGLRQALMVKIGQQFGITATVNHITESRLTQLTGDFDAKSKNIQNIQGIEYLENINKVYLNGNPFSNVTALQNLTQLHTLDISGTSVSDITSLNKLTNLVVLDVENSDITNLTALTTMSQLQVLTLSGTPVADLTPLTNLTNLTNFVANDTNITSLAPLQKSTKMKVLHVEGNALVNLTGLSGMTQLNDLKVGQNLLTNISAIKNLTSLTSIDLNTNKLTSIADLTSLVNVTNLNVSSNVLTNITGVTNMSKLAYLDIETNRIVSIAELSNKTLLKTFRANDNRIWDLTPLANKGTMTELVISNNIVGKLPTNLNGFPDSAYHNNFIPGKSGQNELRAISSQMMEEDALLNVDVTYTTIQNTWTSKVTPKVTITGNSGISAENVKWNTFRLVTNSPSNGVGTVTYELNPDVKRTFQVTVLAVMPEVVVTPVNGTEWTNGTVTLDVKASNRVTDIARIFLPNGTNVLASETQYVVSKNGIYGFAVLDGYGRLNYTYYEVRNIDTKAPSVTVIVPGDWSNQDPTIQVDVINE